MNNNGIRLIKNKYNILSIIKCIFVVDSNFCFITGRFDDVQVIASDHGFIVDKFAY